MYDKLFIEEYHEKNKKGLDPGGRAASGDPRLDPLSSRRLDELILQLRDSLGSTVVVVTHELQSIFTIASNSVFLDPVTKTMLTTGNPKELRDHSEIPEVRAFLTRGEVGGAEAGV